RGGGDLNRARTAVAAESRGEQDHDGAHPLAAAVEGVIADRGDHGGDGAHAFAHDALDLLEVLAQEGDDALEIRGGGQLACIRQRVRRVYPPAWGHVKRADAKSAVIPGS